MSAGSYVKTVCTVVGGWATDIQARSGALNVASISNVAQGKAALESFFTAAVADTGKVVSKLKSAGTPGVPNGQKISSALQSSFSQIETALTQGQTQAKTLPTSSSHAFKTAGQTLASSIRTSLADAEAGLAGLKSPELASAAKKEPACSVSGG